MKTSLWITDDAECTNANGRSKMMSLSIIQAATEDVYDDWNYLKHSIHTTCFFTTVCRFQTHGTRLGGSKKWTWQIDGGVISSDLSLSRRKNHAYVSVSAYIYKVKNKPVTKIYSSFLLTNFTVDYHMWLYNTGATKLFGTHFVKQQCDLNTHITINMYINTDIVFKWQVICISITTLIWFNPP